MFKFALENLKEKTDSAGIKKAKQYLEKLSKFKVENNCQKFAAALELLYRGITKKVTPTPTPLAKVFDVPVGREFPYFNWCLFKRGEWTPIDTKDSFESVKDTMTKWGNGARAIIAVAWKESHSGHVFNLLNIDGEIYLADGTANRFKPIQGSPYIKEYIDARRSFGLLRTDSGTPDPQMIEDTFGEHKKEFNLDEEKPKYISIAAALDALGKKDHLFTVYRDSKKIGKIRCENIAHKYGDFCTVWNYSWA